MRVNSNGTECLVQHPYRTGQKWKNENFTLYVMDVQDDVKDDAGMPVESGDIVVVEKLPIPGRPYKGAPLSPGAMDTVIEGGKFTLLADSWFAEFQAVKDSQDAALKAAGYVPGEPAKPAPSSGLGIALD